MAQPVFKVNRTGRTIYVADYNGNREAGIIVPDEVFVSRGDIDGNFTYDIWYYNADWRQYRSGQISYDDHGQCADAYSPYHTYYKRIGKNGNTQYVFQVRSGMRARIYKGASATSFDATYGSSGGLIATSGASNAGYTYPDRLHIEGYYKNGIWNEQSDLWCDTDVLFGYPTRPTIYSSKMP